MLVAKLLRARTAAAFFPFAPSALQCRFLCDSAFKVPDGDHILRGTCIREDLEVFSIKADNVAREAQRRHQASPAAAAVLGRLMMGTLLMNSIYPEAHIVKVSLVGDGPVGYANGVATDRTFSKAMVQFPQCEVPLKPDGRVDVKAALGNCEVHIICDFPQWNEKSKLYKFMLGPSGELAEAIAFFLREEDEIDAVAAFGVTFDEHGIVKTARGFIGLIYPLSNKDTCKQLIKNISKLPSLYDAAAVDVDAHQLILRLLDNVVVGTIDEPIIPQFGPCSQEALIPQMKEALVAYPTDTLEKLVADKEYLDVLCVYTTEQVRLERSVLDAALRRAREIDELPWKQQLFMTPEEKWLQFKAAYIGKRPGRAEEQERQSKEQEKRSKEPQKLVPYDAGLPSRIGAIRRDSYASVGRKFPPLSPFPPKPKQKPPKRKELRRP